MKTDLAIVKKNLSHLRATANQDSIFKVEFKKADGSLFSIGTLNIPNWIPDGEYKLTAYCLDNEEQELILDHEILIESKKEAPEQTAQTQKQNDPSTDLLFKLREQDQASWERERNLINKYWETETSRVRTETVNEIKTLKEKHEFEMNLLKKNSDVLESERDKIRESISKELRIEKKFDNSIKKRTFGDRLLDMIDSNPDLLLAVFEKFKVVDPETVDALKAMNAATNNIQN